MLEYFGQSPIIVRSSSLLEDNYGNAFAGKYESVFCPNQGPQPKRLEDFLSAVKTIYASAMSEKALRYRAQRGLLDQDEQMSLLVQRVSGGRYGNLFFPQIAGVALSRNPYVWNECIDPEAGVVRLVFGLGTRAVDRSDDDYTRIVALNAPERRPEGDLDRVRQYSQRKVDVIDLEANRFMSHKFADVAARSDRLPLHIFASQNGPSRQEDWSDAPSRPHPVLTFEELLSQTPFVGDMREMLQVLQKAYDYPVDLEFTANFFAEDVEKYKINLVQCRPLQVASDSAAVALPKVIDPADCVLEAHGAVIGRSRANLIDRVVYVVPTLYGQLPLTGLLRRGAIDRTAAPPGRAAAAARDVDRAGPLGHHHAFAGRARLLRRNRHGLGALRNRRHARGPRARRLPGHAFLQRPGGDGHALPGLVPPPRGQLLEPRLLRAVAQPPGRVVARRGPLVGGGPRHRHAAGLPRRRPR